MKRVGLGQMLDMVHIESASIPLRCQIDGIIHFSFTYMYRLGCVYAIYLLCIVHIYISLKFSIVHEALGQLLAVVYLQQTIAS